jgi:hypothetical protein
MFANSLLILFSSSSRARAFLRSAMKDTRPVRAASVPISPHDSVVYTSHRRYIARVVPAEQPSSSRSGRHLLRYRRRYSGGRAVPAWMVSRQNDGVAMLRRPATCVRSVGSDVNCSGGCGDGGVHAEVDEGVELRWRSWTALRWNKTAASPGLATRCVSDFADAFDAAMRLSLFALQGSLRDVERSPARRQAQLGNGQSAV